MNTLFQERLQVITTSFQKLVEIKNHKLTSVNGIYDRYEYPVLTSAHIPLNWRFDLNEQANPFLLERFGINAVFNSGAIKFKNKYILVARVEGNDRKSFFAVAESENGIDNFKFWNHPVVMPPTDAPEVNLYDMRLIQHEDGWIYGLFCTERRDENASEGDQSAAIAQCGIARTRDFVIWDRLPNLITPSPQQRNVVLHPEFYKNKYAFYTRPQDSFLEAGTGGGIGFGLCDDIENAVIKKEIVIDKKKYHSVYEAKNGLGPAPIKTPKGWLHLAHGVRNTAAGLRYVLYIFMTDLDDITKVTYRPGGYFMAPEGEERVGDVSNVIFSNGWILDDDGTVFIYYAASDSRMHVATSTINKLLDYTINSPADKFSSNGSVKTVLNIINRNISKERNGDGETLNGEIKNLNILYK